MILRLLSFVIACAAGAATLVMAQTPSAFAPAPSARRLLAGDQVVVGRRQDIGNGLVFVAGPIGAASVRGGQVDRAYRIVESAPDASGRLLIEGISATNVSRGLARIRGDLTGAVRACDVSFTTTPQVAPHLPAGLAFDGTAHDWTIENVTIRGAQMVLAPDRYWNGDGISTELGNRRFLFRNVRVYDSTDAGFDLKSTETRLEDTLAEGNSRNYRFWKDVQTGTITSVEPVVRGGRTNPAHIWITGKFNPTIRIRNLIVRASKSRAAVIRVEDGPATVIVDHADIKVPPGTPLVVGARATVHWRSGTPVT